MHDEVCYNPITVEEYFLRGDLDSHVELTLRPRQTRKPYNLVQNEI